LAIDRFDHANPFSLIACDALQDHKFLCHSRRRAELIDDRRRNALERCCAALRGNLPVYHRSQHVESFQIVDLDEIGGVAGPQQANIEFVMQHRIDAGRLQYGEQRLTEPDRAHHELINVPDD
jgi:hypothetical protein